MTDEIEDRGDNDLTLVIESQDLVIKTLKQDNAALLLEKGEWQSDRVKLNGTEQLVADLTKKLTEIIRINKAVRALNADIEIDIKALKNDNIKLAEQVGNLTKKN
ncbi:MAG: hypothetical protein ACKVHI_09230 [Candidatus Puniceispirillales bacterium]|jgi:hypothetical protein|tara:strand:+ start:237 stop:551 length:315 start_codon:yes stop_codon:yes gene_type:complete